MVNDGIFVKIAKPKEMPESSVNVLAYLSRILLSSIKRIEVSINGNIIESNTTLRVNHVDGVTAKSREENKATVGLNLRSDILYIKKVSTIAIAPIIKRGTANKDSIEDASDTVFKYSGKFINLNTAAKKICPKNG